MEEIATREILPKPQFEIRQEKSLEFIALTIKDYEDIGDDEAVFMLALTLDHPEWKDSILEQMKQHKPHVQNVEKILEKLRKNYSGWQSQSQPNAEDVMWWTEHLPETKTRIADLIAYFRPSSGEVAKKIIIVPSDKLLSSKDTGSSFHVGDTTVIMSHTENTENFEHEFLHGIINPMTEELAGKIPQEKVVALASSKLKVEEMYGDHSLSLLNEELIRTYNFIKFKRPIRTLANFTALVDSLSEDRFTELISTEPRTKERFATVGISSLADFKAKVEEYYNRYEKNELRERVYHLYERFNAEKVNNPSIKFKDFFAREIGGVFN